MNRVFTVLLIFPLSFTFCFGQASQKEIINTSTYSSSLALRNGGYSFLDISFTRFQVQGVVRLLNDKIQFAPDTVFKSTSKRKVFRYNHLMCPISILYSDIEQIKYGLYFANFFPIRVPTIITKDKLKYRFSVKKSKTFINDLKLKQSK